MNAKAKIEVPGEVALPGMPGATDQPPTEANEQKVEATRQAIPDALTLEQMQAEFFRMKKQLDEQSALIAQQSNVMTQQPQPAEPVSQADAEKQAKKHVESGEVPPAQLTEQGWYVHELSHSSAEAVEKQQERDEKKQEKQAKKKAA